MVEKRRRQPEFFGHRQTSGLADDHHHCRPGIGAHAVAGNHGCRGRRLRERVTPAPVHASATGDDCRHQPNGDSRPTSRRRHPAAYDRVERAARASRSGTSMAIAHGPPPGCRPSARNSPSMAKRPASIPCSRRPPPAVDAVALGDTVKIEAHVGVLFGPVHPPGPVQSLMRRETVRAARGFDPVFTGLLYSRSPGSSSHGADRRRHRGAAVQGRQQ